MGVNLTPYVHLDGTAATALAYYGEVLGGTPQIMTFGEFGMEGADAAKVMHGQLDTPAGLTLMCSDIPSHMSADHGKTVTIALSGDDAPALRGWFKGLAEGGTVDTPLEKQMWGDEFGQVTDRFGIEWLVNITDR